MSNKLSNKQEPAKSAISADELWRSGRVRWSWRQFHRGRDKKWHFAGQKPDEVVRLVVRKHWVYLVRPALPFVGTIIAFIAFMWLSVAYPAAGSIWMLLEIIDVILAMISLGWFIWKDFIVWWLETFIITDKRIISSRGLLEPVRQDTPLEKVQQIGIDVQSLWKTLLMYGTVHVYLTGGDIVMRDVSHPRQVKDSILGIVESYRATKPAEEKPPVPQDPEMKALLEKLSKGKEVPKLPDADEHYPAPKDPDRVRGPRRTFGGFLRIPCDVRYTSGEYTVAYVQRSRYILYRNLLIPILGLFVAVPLTLYAPFNGLVPAALEELWWVISSLIILGLILYILLVYTNWADDVFILTNKRIIDIERRLIFLYEMRMETEYKNIRDVRVLVPNVIERLLDIGNIYIQTPGSTPDITMNHIDHPFYILDKINDIRTNKEKIDAAKKFNDEKKELNKWFANIVCHLEQNTQFKGAPSLKGMDLLEAMEVAGELGFNVTVWEEAPSDDYEPGRIIHQSPPPGTLIGKGGEIQVVLSRSYTSADIM